MAQADYIRFLVATKDDPVLKAALHRSSGAVVTLGDLVSFAARHGYRFTEQDIPLKAA
ncbi:Nif11-like leader peptide family natural product precursor [Azospirillum sp. sgz302134]